MEYWKQRQQQKLKGKTSLADVKAGKKVKGDWYSEKIAQAKKCRCENCNGPLLPSMVINAATVVAHICSKSKVPSVAFADKNFMFLCAECHNTYDKASNEEVEMMQVFEIARDRVQTFKHLIPSTELRHVHLCLL